MAKRAVKKKAAKRAKKKSVKINYHVRAVNSTMVKKALAEIAPRMAEAVKRGMKQETKQLYGQYHYPVAEAPLSPTGVALDFAKVLTPSGFPFGIADKEQVGTALRALARRIEQGQVLFQGAESNVKVMLDDFAMTKLTLTMCEKKPK